LQKSTSAEVGILMLPSFIFHDFGWPWNQFSCGSWHFWYPNKPVIWHAWWLHFGVLGDLGRSWDIGGHKKGHFEIQAWILIDFCRFRDFILKAFWVRWTTNVYFVMLVSSKTQKTGPIINAVKNPTDIGVK